MSKDAIKRVAALGAVAALAAAPAAFADQPADPGSNGNGHDNQTADHGNSANAPGHTGDHGNAGGQAGQNGNAGGNADATVMYVFKGVYAGSSSVDVKSGNAHVRKSHLDGTTVAFDLTDSAIVAKDRNDDGKVDLADVKAGDNVVVKARLPLKAAGTQPFAAQQLVDQTRKDPAPDGPTS